MDMNKPSPSEPVPEYKENKDFEIALRILGNEVLAIKISVKNFTHKWIVFSLLSIVMVFFFIHFFGADIVSLYKAIQ